jgi:hypothetical protein
MQMINKTTQNESEQLFGEIVRFLSRKRLLVDILTGGMRLKIVTKILDEVVGQRIQIKRLPFRGVPNPDLNKFWASIEAFYEASTGRAVILGLAGVHDHWTVIESITKDQIILFDSDDLKKFHRVRCTTSDPKGKRKHVLCPAQTYFLSNEV